MIILSKIFISVIIIVICIIFALVVINTIIDFKNKNINKVVWLKVKKNNVYGYAIRQRGYVFALRYSYSKSKKIAKGVPKILEDTLYFKVYYNDEETKK